MTNCSRSACRRSSRRLATGYLATFRTDITDAITKMVDELFHSPKLATLWNNANAKAHSDFVQIMQGTSPGKLHTLNVDLSSAVTEIKQKLESSGVQLGVADPRYPGGVQHRRATPMCNRSPATTTCWTPSAPGCRSLRSLLLLLSILIAPSRLGGLSKAAGWLAFSMVVLTVGLLAGRQWLVSQAPLAAGCHARRSPGSSR